MGFTNLDTNVELCDLDSDIASVINMSSPETQQTLFARLEDPVLIEQSDVQGGITLFRFNKCLTCSIRW